MRTSRKGQGGRFIQEGADVKRLACMLALTCALFAACQVQFISTYDETTDRGVTEVQRSLESHLGRLEDLALEPPGLESLVEDCKPDRFDDTYRELKTNVQLLVVRNEARDKNTLTTQQLKDLSGSIDLLRELQVERYGLTDAERPDIRPGDRCMNKEMIAASRSSLQQHIRAILTLELAKREFRKEE